MQVLFPDKEISFFDFEGLVTMQVLFPDRLV